MGSDTFTYDAVSRLRTATLPGSSVTEGDEYDPFGNRTSVARPGGVLTIPTDSATNRLLGTDEVPVEYDSAGNVTVWGTATYTWDPFNMLLRLENPDADTPRDEVYVYTADDERLATVTVSPVTATWSVRGLDGKVLRQFSEGGGSWTWAKDYIYRGSQLLATDIEAIGMRHFHLDHLGTPRLITKSNGSHAATHEYLPFGEEAVVNADGEVMRFTGHERDPHGHAPAQCGPDTKLLFDTSITTDQVACTSIIADPDVDIPSGSVRFKAGETIALGNGFTVASGAEFVAELDQMLAEGVYQSLDYMHARYSSPLMGRFLSVDPITTSARLSNPQSWNRYTYTVNNPVRFLDPTGELWVSSNGAYDWVDSCPTGNTCYGAVAARVGRNLVIYGSASASDVMVLRPNSNGYFDLSSLASHPDAGFQFKPGAQTFLSAEASVAFFNTASQHQLAFPGSQKLFVTDMGVADGSHFGRHKTHDQGRSIDLRYQDASGRSIQDSAAIRFADVNRTRFLIDAATGQGFDQNYTGDRSRFGGTGGLEVKSIHRHHLHLGFTIGRVGSFR